MRDQLKATLTGQKVLAGLAKGRAIAIQRKREQAAVWMVEIVRCANEDRAAGRPRRGLAGRISRKLRGTLKERLVRKYLALLFSGADLLRQTERLTNHREGIQ